MFKFKCCHKSREKIDFINSRILLEWRQPLVEVTEDIGQERKILPNVGKKLMLI